MIDSTVKLEHDFDFWAPHKISLTKKREHVNSQVLPLKSNVVDAWDDMKTVYTKLYEVSQNYCHLIGISVPSERLFSKAELTANLIRNRQTS